MRLCLLLCASICCALNVAAEEYERRLVPVSVVLAQGAFGTQWNTRAVAVQELSEPVEIIGDLSIDVPPGVGGAQPYRIFPLPSGNELPGAILYVPRSASSAVHVSSRVLRDSAEGREETVVPVVSESEFADHSLYFLQLTKDAAHRFLLRAYSLDLDQTAPAVRVRVQAHVLGSAWAVIYETVHILNVRQQEVIGLQDGPFPGRPLALELALDPIFSALPEGADIAVSIAPATAGFHIWGMVSETDNITQHVRIVLPE
jgi:hypothetical protein